MFDKFFDFIGFSTSKNLVGLSQLADNKLQPAFVKQPIKKELKLSDLMRGN